MTVATGNQFQKEAACRDLAWAKKLGVPPIDRRKAIELELSGKAHARLFRPIDPVVRMAGLTRG
jgi:hypothetical protein